MRRVAFDEKAWDDYNEWGRIDRKTQAKIIDLIDDCRKEPVPGTWQTGTIKTPISRLLVEKNQSGTPVGLSGIR